MIKRTLRRLIKEAQSTVLHLIGLSTGLACALLIWLWVLDELQTDRFHKYRDRLYQVMTTQSAGNLKKSEQVIGSLSKYFAGLAILISCPGLFGLTAFTAERRKKEISIRKVLGASVKQLTFLLSGDFLQLVTISIVIAFPLAAWIMEKWLQGFAYRIHLQPYIFLVAAFATLVVTVCTISVHSMKAAFSSPVKALRAG